jgi:ubiquinone/menaquinone biosynthesis C-methylase UbiE
MGNDQLKLTPSGFYGQLSGEWEKKYETRPSFRSRERILDAILGRLVRPGDRWLDAGCGTGRFSRLLVRKGAAHVQGIDGSTEMIGAALRLAAEAGLEGRAGFAWCDGLETIAYPAGAFDGILCSSVLEYVDRPDLVAAEFARLLKPGGKLVLSLPNRFAWMRLLQKGQYRLTGVCGGQPRPAYLGLVKNQYTPGLARRLIAGAGLTLERMTCGGSGLFRGWVDRLPVWGPLLFLECRKEEAGPHA